MVNLFQRRKSFRGPPPPQAPSYANSGGSGDRSALITLTQAAYLNSRPGMVSPSIMINGVNNAGTAYFNTHQAYMYDGWWLMFDFGTPKLIDEFKWYQQNSSTHGTWKFQGSLDNSTWVDIGTSFTLGGSTTQTVTEISSNILGYRYYRLYLVTGPSSNLSYLYEIEFKIANYTY